MVFALNTLNNEWLPLQGIKWTTEYTALAGLNGNANSFSSLRSNMDIYAPLSPENRLLAALHLGGGHILSPSFEYFQALTLGGDNYLRGYRMQRFAGSSVVYASAELRAKLTAFNFYIIKGDFGLVAFNDIGRVWITDERSTLWHDGYGGGIYIIPFKTAMLSLLVGWSPEDRVLNAAIGSKLNIVFH